MNTARILINPAKVIALATILAFPLHSTAQDGTSFGGRPSRPICVYKGVMTDAEIEVCTGRRIYYNYAVYYGPSIAVASYGGSVQQVSYSGRTYSGRAPRATRH